MDRVSNADLKAMREGLFEASFDGRMKECIAYFQDNYVKQSLEILRSQVELATQNTGMSEEQKKDAKVAAYQEFRNKVLHARAASRPGSGRGMGGKGLDALEAHGE